MKNLELNEIETVTGGVAPILVWAAAKYIAANVGLVYGTYQTAKWLDKSNSTNAK